MQITQKEIEVLKEDYKLHYDIPDKMTTKDFQELKYAYLKAIQFIEQAPTKRYQCMYERPGVCAYEKNLRELQTENKALKEQLDKQRQLNNSVADELLGDRHHESI